MADERIVKVTIQSQFEGKGTVDAKKATEDLQKTVQKTNASMVNGAEKASSSIVNISAAINVVQAAWGAVRGVIGWLAESVTMANKNARAVNMLSAAYQNVGYTAGGAVDAAKKFASEMQNLTGLADEVFLDGQRLLANYGVVGTKAQEAIRAAYALSVSQGMSFESSLMQIAKAAAGSTGALSRYGIVLGDGVKDGEKFDAVLKQINDRFGASAQATMGDMATQVNALKEEWGDFREEIGNNLIPALRKLIEWGHTAIGVMRFIGGDNGETAFSEAMENTNKEIAKINQEIAEYNRLRAAAPRMVDNEIAKLENQLKILEGRKKILMDGNDEYLKSQAMQRLEAQKQAEQIEKNRQAQVEKAKTAKQETEDQKAVTDELKRQQEILDNMGLSSSKDLKGWNRDKEASQEGPSELEIFAGGQNALGSAVDAVAQYDAEAERLEALRELKLEYINNEITDEQLKQEALANLEEQYNQQKLNNDKNQAKARQQVYASMWSAMASLAGSENKKIAAVGKIAGVAQATISTFTGAAKALELPFPANLAAMATVLAQGFALVGQIQSIKMAEGGLVKAVTGGVPAVIGEGRSDEAVLPLDDSQAMRRIGGAIAEESGAVGGVVLTQNITIQAGESLIPDITNALRNATVDALEMANLTVKVGNGQQGYSV